MDFFSHLAVGILTSLVTLRALPPEYLILAGLMAIMPDGDVFLTPIYIKTKSYYWTHRGGSHSYVVGMIVSVIVSLIFTSVYNGIFFYYWLVGSLFYGLHITLDLFTTSRVPIFYPISKREYRFCGERAINPVLMLSSLLIIILFVQLDQISAKWSIFNTLRLTFFYVYYTYFTYKFISKVWIQNQLPSNQLFIPGLLPLVYFVHENSTTEFTKEFCLYKKIQFFSYSRKILESCIEKDSIQMEFLDKALAISKDYRFFLKWRALIPLISETGDNIIVLLHLAESYTHNSGYFLEINFNKESREIVEINQGFGFFKGKK